MTELDPLILSQAHIREPQRRRVSLQRLESTLQDERPHERPLVLRQCIEQIGVNKPDGSLQLKIYAVPAGGLSRIETLNIHMSELV